VTVDSWPDILDSRSARCGRSFTAAPNLGTMAAEWTTSDAWVFASIEGSGPEDGYCLSQLIARADGINHAVLMEAEFAQAVPRLVAAGLVGADSTADRYWLTEAGRKLYDKRMKRHDLFGWIEAIPPALRQLGEPQDAEWPLPSGAFDRAVREYVRFANRNRTDPGGR